MVALFISPFLPKSSTNVSYAANGMPKPDHVVIVVMENHSYQSIIGNSQAPYMNRLVQMGALLTNAYGNEHPSQPNYLDLFSGSNQGVRDDSCPHSYNGINLGSELIRTNQSFAGYSEDMPYNGYTGCNSNQYWRKHNPWVNFTNVPSNANKTLSEFPSNYNQLPTVSIVVPNQMNDMHDGTINQADTWLQTKIDQYVQWAMLNNSLLILTWDEDDYSFNNKIPMIFVGPMVKQGNSAEYSNHFNVLRTLCDMYGLTAMNGSSNVQPLRSIWVDLTDTTKPTAPGTPAITHRSTTNVSFQWSASTDNQKVVGYEVYRNGSSIGKTTQSTYTDSTISQSDSVSYQVVAIDAVGNRSATSSAVQLPLWSSAPSNQLITLYLKSTEAQWLHYQPGGYSWTSMPGFQMTPSSFNGYYSIQIWNANGQSIVASAFHNSSFQWNNNGGKNYSFLNGTWTIENGIVRSGEPYTVDLIAPSIPTSLTSSSQTNTTISLSWTLSTDNNGVKEYQVFRNGTMIGTSAVNNFIDSALPSGTSYTYSVRAIDNAGNLSGASNLLGTATKANGSSKQVQLYYFNSSASMYIHYRPDGGVWTTAPGVKLTASSYSGYVTATIDIGSSTSISEAAFNNNAGTWDNNNSKNYRFPTGVWTVQNGSLRAGLPDATTNKQVIIYYKVKSSKTFIHYRMDGSTTWTTSPGIELSSIGAPTNYKTIVINTTTTNGIAESAFNDGTNGWDNNSGKNYRFIPGIWTLDNGTVKAGTP